MPIYKRQELPKLLSEVKQGITSQIYLIWGERYLCRSAAQDLIDHLLPEKNRHSTSLHHIDGDQEDFSKTLNLLKTFSQVHRSSVSQTQNYSIPKESQRTFGKKHVKKMNGMKPNRLYDIFYRCSTLQEFPGKTLMKKI